MSVFDPDTFLQASVDAAFETRLSPVPEGEYLAVIGEDGLKPRTAKDRVILDITWSILDEALKAQLGMQKVTVRQSVFLDLDENGRLLHGPNKNIDLGRIREALSQNVPGWIPSMLRGAGPAKIKVTQRMDPEDSSKIYNDVKGVTKAA